MAEDRIGELELRPEEMDVVVAGMRAGLTRREFELLTALAARPDQVISREELYERVWGGQMRKRDRSVDVFVRKLRTKLDAASPGWEYIHTRFGIGYRLAPERRTNGSSPLVHQRETGPSQGGR
jgi:DNA-binding response OmpR family regulator